MAPGSGVFSGALDVIDAGILLTLQNEEKMCMVQSKIASGTLHVVVITIIKYQCI